MYQQILIGLLLVLVGLSATAQPGTGPYPGYRSPWQPPPGQYNYAPPDQRQTGTPSPMPRSPGLQNPYSSGWPMRQQPGYGQTPYYTPAAPSNGQPPRLETRISARSPYVQENILLYLDVISSHNLKTATPELPQGGNMILQKIEGPTASRVNRKDAQNIKTSFIYQIKPLRTGRIEIPTIRVTGEQEQSGYGRTYTAFEAVSEDSLVLDVKPADPRSKPWLPLEELTLKTTLPKNTKAVAGQPISLTIEMSAVGASGSQLPSLEKQLKSDAFRVYREKTRTHTKLSRKKSKIVGRRIETFTLVPQYGGDLKLPELRVAWWNTRNNSPQHVSTPVKPLAVSGGRRGEGLFGMSKPTTLFPAGSPAAFWIPVSVIFGVIFGYWLAIWISNRKKEEAPIPAFAPLTNAMKKPFRNMAPAFAPLGEKVRATRAILNPVTRWQKIRRHLIGLLPLSIRFWYCVRFVETENDPEVWGYTLRFLANKHLDLPPRAPFSAIGKRILEFHPKADPARIKQLVHELDQSIYGDSRLDFAAWKRAFKYEIRPRLRLLPRFGAKTKRVAQQQLPTLNPKAVA
ncbi:MAG: BatD family protein [Gammaproteobacteria bacterium]|nr:BatD family protein [Gammaproteobacteria bacterium]